MKTLVCFSLAAALALGATGAAEAARARPQRRQISLAQANKRKPPVWPRRQGPYVTNGLNNTVDTQTRWRRKDGTIVKRVVSRYAGQIIGTSYITRKGNVVSTVYRSTKGAVAVARNWFKGPFEYAYEERGGAEAGSASVTIGGPFALEVKVSRGKDGVISERIQRDLRRVFTEVAVQALLAEARTILANPPPEELKILESARIAAGR